jgi:hypothetical protein
LSHLKVWRPVAAKIYSRPTRVENVTLDGAAAGDYERR